MPDSEDMKRFSLVWANGDNQYIDAVEVHISDAGVLSFGRRDEDGFHYNFLSLSPSIWTSVHQLPDAVPTGPRAMAEALEQMEEVELAQALERMSVFEVAPEDLPPASWPEQVRADVEASIEPSAPASGVVSELEARMIERASSYREDRISSLRAELAHVLNTHNSENESGTPDGILASFVLGCLQAWDNATRQRDLWWGFNPKIGGSVPAGERGDDA